MLLMSDNHNIRNTQCLHINNAIHHNSEIWTGKFLSWPPNPSLDGSISLS